MSVGNPNAAQDLYGVGVRIGLYLQALGMMLSNHTDREGRGKGLKMASGTITLSVGASWFVYAAQAKFSPSEAVCVLLMLSTLLAPSTMTLLTPTTINGEKPGLLALAISDTSITAAWLWIFGRLVSTLPKLGTKNLVFFFAPVRLDGWFRYLALVLCIVNAILSLQLLAKIIRILRLRKPTADQIEKVVGWSDKHTTLVAAQWMLFPLLVTAVEVTLWWNNLAGSTDFQSPGQLIPLITGTMVFIDGLVAVLRRVSLLGNGPCGGFRIGRRDSDAS